MKFLVMIVFAFILALPATFAQEVHQELQETVRAEVLEILNEKERDIIGTDTTALVQEVRIRVLEGVQRGEEAVFENDLMQLNEGDSIYVNRLMTIDGIEYYTFKDADRSTALVSLVGLFVVVLCIFSGMQGVRAIASLGVSIAAIFFILVPLLLSGYSPVLVSIIVAGVILAVALFMTHGFNTRATIAFLGTLVAVSVTSICAAVWVNLANFTGLSSDEAIFLNFSTKGALDFGGLLLGSIIIGILGVLDDVAITQASVVQELKRANKELGFGELYTRALRVGRDHVSSLVNTLAFAYIGVALPLVLLLVKAESSPVLSLNQEVVSVELVRILIGSLGLILAVPFTTSIAAWWWSRYPVKDTGENHLHMHGTEHYKHHI